MYDRIQRDDALDIRALIDGPVIIVVSSMRRDCAAAGIAVLVAAVKGVTGLAAAPDFTDMFARLTPPQQKELMDQGVLYVPNDYSDILYTHTKALYEDGKTNLLLTRSQTVRTAALDTGAEASTYHRKRPPASQGLRPSNSEDHIDDGIRLFSRSACRCGVWLRVKDPTWLLGRLVLLYFAYQPAVQSCCQHRHFVLVLSLSDSPCKARSYVLVTMVC